jgi:hypothetical protein
MTLGCGHLTPRLFLGILEALALLWTSPDNHFLCEKQSGEEAVFASNLGSTHSRPKRAPAPKSDNVEFININGREREREGDPTEDEPRAEARYEPIKTEKSTKDVEANNETRGSRVNLSRTQSATSAFTDVSEDSEPKSSIRRRKWYRTNPLKWGPRPPVPKEREVCPEYTAGILSRLTWQWMQPLMNVGYKRPLEKNDLWSVNPKRSATVLAERLDTSFQKRLEQGHDRPLLRAMFDTFVSIPRGADCGLADVLMFTYRNGSS